MTPRRTTSLRRIQELRQGAAGAAGASGGGAGGFGQFNPVGRPSIGPAAGANFQPAPPVRGSQLRPGARPATPQDPAPPRQAPAPAPAPARGQVPVRRVGQPTTARQANQSRFTRFGAIQSGAASGVQTPTPTPRQQPVASVPGVTPGQPRPVIDQPVTDFMPGGGRQLRPGVQTTARPQPTADQGATIRAVAARRAAAGPTIGQTQAGLTAAPTVPEATAQTDQGTGPGAGAGSTPPPVDLGRTFESNESFQAMQAWAAEMQAKGYDQFTDEDWANWERWLTIDRNRPQGWLTPGFGRSDEGIEYEEAENLGGFDNFADLARALNIDEAEVRALTAEGYRFRRGLDDDRIYIQTPNSNSMQLWEAFATTPVAEEARTRDQESEELSQVEEFKRYLEELGVGDTPVFDEQAIEDLILSNREANALAEAQNVQAIMERAARAGASPEAVSGLIADAAHASRVAQAQQENQMRLAGAEQNFQAQMAEYQRQYNAAMQLLNMAEDARTREMAQQYAQRMAVLQHELNKQYQQYVFELGAPTSGDIGASLFGALGSLGGAYFGPAGAIGGGAAGSALGTLAFG